MLVAYRDYLGQDVSLDDTAARSLLNPIGVSCLRLDEKTIDVLIAVALSNLPSAFTPNVTAKRLIAPDRAGGRRCQLGNRVEVAQ